MVKSGKTSELDEIEHELHGVEDELQDFEQRQVNVTRTLQMIVYPAMVAFIILSAYGFYLVQSLTTDVHRLTQTIADMNQSVSTSMVTMTGTMTTMNDQMGNLVQSTGIMTDSTQDMAGNIQQMNASTQNMAVSTYNMQRDMWSMNKNISGPMKMFNKFSPFGSDKTTPYVVPPPVVGATPYYNGYYGWPQATATPQQQAPVSTQSIPATTLSSPPIVSPTSGTAPEAVVQEAPPASGNVTPAPEGAATAKDGHSAIDDPLRQQQILASMTKG